MNRNVVSLLAVIILLGGFAPLAQSLTGLILTNQNQANQSQSKQSQTKQAQTKQGQTNKKTPTSVAGASNITPSKNSLLWEIRSERGRVSHIFGTIHLKDSAVLYQRDTVLQIMSKAMTYYSELDLDSALGGGIDPMSMMLPPDKTLGDYFTDEQFVLIRKTLREKLGPLSTMAERMKPAAIVALLMMENFNSTNTNDAMDVYLWNRAKEIGLECLGVETIQEQLALMDEIPPSVLLDMITSPESEDSLINVLLDAYATENLTEVAILIEEAGSMEGFMTKLNDDRNRVMVDRLKSDLEIGKVFIAVGAAHLPGRLGILKLLEGEGFIVTPVHSKRRSYWVD